jgi:predicted dehydrogenase
MFGIGRAYDDPERMLAEVELDALVVIVPPEEFGPLIRRAIEHRLPAFVEKPGAGSADEAAELAAQAADAAVPILVGYQKRFAAGYRRAKGLIDAAEFGPPTLASFTWAMGPFLGRFSFRYWLFENPVHHFDLARYLVGELAEVDVRASYAGGEFAVAVNARADSGAVVSIRANTTASWEQHNEAVEVFGLGHSVLVDNVDTCVHRPPEGPERVWRPNYTVPARANLSGETLGYGAELAHFRRVVLDGAPVESDLASAAATLRLAGEIARIAGG